MPRIHKLIQQKNHEEATQLWYKLDPARKTFGSVPVASVGLINRMIWKYQSWLPGYNWGPIPHPTPRIYARDMIALRRGLEMADLNPTRDPDEAFFVGRQRE